MLQCVWLCSMRELSPEQRNWLEINVYRVLENTGFIVNPDMSALFCIYMCIITYVRNSIRAEMNTNFTIRIV